MGTIHLYFRPVASGRHSIERVFRTVADSLESEFQVERLTLSGGRRGMLGRLRAMNEVLGRRDGIHHVTGDVHFLVLVLPWSRTVLTIHDLVHLHDLQGVRRWIYRLLWFSIPLRLAARVTAISDHTRDDLLAQFPFVADKLFVIPNPLPAGLTPSPEPRKRGPKPVILHVGTGANKNLPFSISVAKEVKACLVIIGELTPEAAIALRDVRIDYRAHQNVPDAEMPHFYRDADVLLFPSFAEGFGMPVIEAQACGIPVVTSDIEPMRSVAGSSALLVNPNDPEHAAHLIRKLLTDPALYRSMSEGGLNNVSRFASSRIGKEYANVYRSIA